MPNAVVLRGGVFGRWLSHEGSVHIQFLSLPSKTTSDPFLLGYNNGGFTLEADYPGTCEGSGLINPAFFIFYFCFFFFSLFFFFFFFFFFLRQVSLCSPDYPGAHSVDQSQPRIQRLACLYLMNAGESYFLSFFLKDLFVYLMFIGVLPLCTYIFMRVLDPLELEL